jgi:LysM repeat protein
MPRPVHTPETLSGERCYHKFANGATRPPGIIGPMTDRALSNVDGSSACPFVAFEDDREERADRPDHRHRCFAEAVPAPRALAHQEAYCLSSAFPVCPTFQDWARREAAQAKPSGAGVSAGVGEGAAAAAAATASDDSDDDGDDDADDLWSSHRDVPMEERPRRNPPRDWAAPPPWAAGGAAGAAAGAAAGGAMASGGVGTGGRGRDDSEEPGVPEEGRGLAGSAADRLASGEDPDHAWIGPGQRPRPPGHDSSPSPAAPPDPELAGLVGRRPGRPSADDDAAGLPPPSARRPTVSSTRDRSRERERERERQREAEERAYEGPSWERARRYEAYPSIRTRARLPAGFQVPRLAVMFGALIVAAFLLFLLPGLLNIGGRVDAPGGSASPSGAVASESLEPTAVPVPTPQIYTIKAGDALARIARRFGLTLDQLLAANKSITNPNRIKVGDKIVIPTPPPPDEVSGGQTSPSPSASP